MDTSNSVIKYKSFLAKRQHQFNPDEKEILLRAFEIASNSLKGKYLDTGEPYISRSVEVAKIASEMMGLGGKTIIASLLTDAVDSGGISLDEVAEIFDNEVKTIIEGLIKLSKVDSKETATKFEQSKNEAGKKLADSKKLATHFDNYIKLLLTIAEDVRSIMLRLANRLYIMRQIDRYPDALRTEIARETSRFHAPIAHRLGLYKVKTELEELSMKYTESEMYRFIANKLKATKKERNTFIENFIAPLKANLEEHGLECEIKGRPKSIHSIWKKMKRQKVEFEGIYDLFAIRIILTGNYDNYKEEKSDCWEVYSIITDIYQPNPKRLRDWISNPKTSGYESLHTTVMTSQGKWVEVQIRTSRMDEIAEKGHAAHWKYKDGGKDKGHDEWLAKVRDLLENPQSHLPKKIDETKAELYSGEIFVFTPGGELKKLKDKSTVLDFAYQIHTDIGNRCTGAIVNDSMVSIKQTLKNGDHIKVITSKNQKPRPEWLNIVTSPKAKAKVKKALREEMNKKAEDGKAILKSRFKKLHVEYTDQTINKLFNRFGFNRAFNFFNAVGGGDDKIKIKPEQLDTAIKEIVSDSEEGIKEQSKKQEPKETPKSPRDSECLIIDKNLGKINYELAKCCNPIPGDKIFGFVTVSKGTKIHKVNCPNAKDMKSRFPYRIVKAKWTSDTESAFLANIRIKGADEKGIVSQVSKVINDADIAMKNIFAESKGNHFLITAGVYVNNLNELEYLIKLLKTLKNIQYVSRY